MKGPLTLTFFVILSKAISAQCPLPTANDVEDAVTDQLEGAGEAGSEVTVEIIQYNINCLAGASVKGYYIQATVTVNYTSSAKPETFCVVQLNMNCDGTGWNEDHDFNVMLTPQDSRFGGGVATAEELLQGEVNISCLRCNSITAPTSPSHCLRKLPT